MYCRIKHSGLLKNRFAYFQIGLILSLTMVFFAFNMEMEPVEYEPIIGGDPWVTVEIDRTIPRTAEQIKKPPPPPKVNKTIIMPVEELPEETVQKTEVKPEPVEQYVSAAPVAKVVKPEPKVVKPKPKPVIKELPPEPDPVPDIIVEFPSEMPMFPGCDQGEYQIRKTCAEKKMLAFINKNIEYPNIAKENGIQGMTVIQFVVGKDGSISNIKTLKELKGGCTKEAIRVIKKMPNWNPGIQKGHPVKVYFRLPIRFTLSD